MLLEAAFSNFKSFLSDSYVTVANIMGHWRSKTKNLSLQTWQDRGNSPELWWSSGARGQLPYSQTISLCEPGLCVWSFGCLKEQRTMINIGSLPILLACREIKIIKEVRLLWLLRKCAQLIGGCTYYFCYGEIADYLWALRRCRYSKSNACIIEIS